MSAQGFRVDRLAVLGLGLLGGSVALAARKRGITREIAAASRSQAPLDRALRDGVVDVVGTIAEVVQGAELVVLASPVEAMRPLVSEASPHLCAGAVVTDLGSTKTRPAAELPPLLPEGVTFVGAHPMVGGHVSGAVHARADLFEGACCIVTPIESTPEAATGRVRDFWVSLGARVVERSPEEHDAAVAWVSHLPHLLAFAYAGSLVEAPPTSLEMAGAGFRDFTRIAHSAPELWSGIFADNRQALAHPLRSFGRALDVLADAVASGDRREQERLMASARAILEPKDPSARAGGAQR